MASVILAIGLGWVYSLLLVALEYEIFCSTIPPSSSLISSKPGCGFFFLSDLFSPQKRRNAFQARSHAHLSIQPRCALTSLHIESPGKDPASTHNWRLQLACAITRILAEPPGKDPACSQLRH